MHNITEEWGSFWPGGGNLASRVLNDVSLLNIGALWGAIRVAARMKSCPPFSYLVCDTAEIRHYRCAHNAREHMWVPTVVMGLNELTFAHALWNCVTFWQQWSLLAVCSLVMAERRLCTARCDELSLSVCVIVRLIIVLGRVRTWLRIHV